VSTQAFPLARNWLKECLESHIECPKPEPSAGMPTRVIEIFEHDGELQTRLYHPAVGESQFYIALSYCWGGHQLVTTTTENKAAFAESISIQTLPKTIQDAINTAWELGIHYLWVDSLCIIQNDADDMAREIAKMPQVYGQAICTIMASRASSAQEGFLHDRIATELPHLTCELPYRCPDNQLGSIILLSQDKEFVHEPLDDRGWTLQEYLLSTRILDFGTRQTRWICPSTKNKPGYTDGWRQEPDRNNQRPGSLTIKDESFKQGDLKSKAQQLGYESVIEEWRNVLESYAARKLTVPTDRILAMSGIADRYGAMFQDNYLAGLWKFAFPFELLWMRKASQRPVPRSTKEYQAPSWSWAAITQGISFASLRWTSADSRLELLDCKIELDNQGAPYGAVRSGHLKVRGKMREASWIPVRPQADAWEPTAQALTRRGPDGLEEVLAAYILPDALEEEFSSGWVRSLPVHLLQVVHDPNDPVVGLVLRKLDVGLYSRLGIFAFSWTHFGGEGSGMGWDERNKKFEEQRNWFEDSVPEVVTIV
jgi:hypothetical protein